MLSALGNKVDILETKNVMQFFKNVLSIIVDFKDTDLVAMALRICDKAIRRVFDLEMWEFIDAMDTLCHDIVEVNMINKTFTNNELL